MNIEVTGCNIQEGKFYLLKNGEPVHLIWTNRLSGRRLLKNTKYGWGEAEYIDFFDTGKAKMILMFRGVFAGNPKHDIEKEISFEEIIEKFGINNLNIPLNFNTGKIPEE